MKKYSFSMSVLYQTIRIVLLNLTNNLAAFAAFKSKYTPEFVAALEAELAAAENMKGEQARSLEHESLRTEMIPLADLCREKWQYLKRYIADAFGPTLEVANWDAAGWQYYDAAADNNWDKLREMCNMASVYIHDNSAKLLADGFMPATFEADFNDASNNFNEKYDAFILAEENAAQGTADKITANNNIYDKTVSVCLDGQTLFMNDEVKKKLFSMEAVSELVKPTGTATMVTELTNSETGAPIPGYSLTNTGTERTVTANADGRAEMGQQAGGTNRYKIVADGYEETILTVDVKTGVKTIEKISLTPLISEASRAAIESTPTPSAETVAVN
jgi:hypothetical protein